MANQPRMLEGYRVLDFTQFVAGPTCTRLLAEMGAEVIKLELAPEGDRVRAGGLKPQAPEHKDSSHSTYYLQHNHCKLSFAIDLKKPGAREIVMSMLPKYRRGGRKLRARRDRPAGLLLRRRQEGESEDHHVLDLDGRADRAALGQGRLRLHRAGLCGYHRRHRRGRSGRLRSPRWRLATSRPASRPRWRLASRCSIASAPAKASTSTPRCSTPTSICTSRTCRWSRCAATSSVRARSGSQHPDGGPTGIYRLSRRPIRLHHRRAASMAAVGARDGDAGTAHRSALQERARARATIASSCRRSSRMARDISDPRRCDRGARQGARAMRARAHGQRGGQASASE